MLYSQSQNRNKQQRLSLPITLLLMMGVALFLFWSNGGTGTADRTTVALESAPVAEQLKAGEADQRSLPPLSNVESAPAQKKKTPTPTVRATPAGRATATRIPTRVRPTATPTARPAYSQSGLPIIYYDELPPEAQDTIYLIDNDGPFPFWKDGTEFQNRERLLPRRPRGYYREYTVITPGENDRGARRIIAGEDGELYYTEDHYDSFYEVVD